MGSAFVGKSLIGLGLSIALIGVVVLFADRLPFLKSMGRLPGDINYKGDNWQFHAPLMSSLIFSIVLSAIFWLISYFSNRGGR